MGWFSQGRGFNASFVLLISNSICLFLSAKRSIFGFLMEHPVSEKFWEKLIRRALLNGMEGRMKKTLTTPYKYNTVIKVTALFFHCEGDIRLIKCMLGREGIAFNCSGNVASVTGLACDMLPLVQSLDEGKL